MHRTLLFCLALAATGLAHAQPAADAWTNVSPAPDDRYTNPKRPLYAGPNGWFNFGELRATGARQYSFKAGLQYLATPGAFVLTPTDKLQVASLDFGSATPAPGVYQIASQPDLAGRKVKVSFADVSNKKIVEWSSSGAAKGTVTVSQVNGFWYFKARDLQLTPSGVYNTGELKRPLVLGIEGASKIQ
ncbi:MAG: hypothetical protein EOP39_11155 [Rubrivivax sp.]|nr:MAG: hypothetical protein EOP39_11155 [Rubrivivax sp.]